MLVLVVWIYHDARSTKHLKKILSEQNVTSAWQSNLLDFRLPPLCSWDSRSSGTAWPFQMGQIGCPDASVNGHQNTLHNVAEERRPHRWILWKRNLWFCKPWNPFLLKIYCMYNYWSRHKNLQGLEWNFRFRRRRDITWLVVPLLAAEQAWFDTRSYDT
jgi:hypothetical protein